MFHAGAVFPSSPFLLQLLTLPGGDIGPVLLVGLILPEYEPFAKGFHAVALESLALLLPRSLFGAAMGGLL